MYCFIIISYNNIQSQIVALLAPIPTDIYIYIYVYSNKTNLLVKIKSSQVERRSKANVYMLMNTFMLSLKFEVTSSAEF